MLVTPQFKFLILLLLFNTLISNANGLIHRCTKYLKCITHKNLSKFGYVGLFFHRFQEQNFRNLEFGREILEVCISLHFALEFSENR